MAWADRGAGRVTRPDRRWVLAAGAGLAVATITAGATHVWGPGVPRLHTAPDWYAAHLTNRGARAELDLLNQEWLVSGSVPGRGTDIEDMVRSALLDLRRLTAPSGALAAGRPGSTGAMLIPQLPLTTVVTPWLILGSSNGVSISARSS